MKIDLEDLDLLEIYSNFNEKVTIIKGRNGIEFKLDSVNIDEFKQNLLKYTFKELKQIYSCDKKTIYNFMRRNNIPTNYKTIHRVIKPKPIRHRIRGQHDSHYFDIIDSHRKAYFLGLISADGCISKTTNGTRCLSIMLSSTDEYILNILHSELNTKRICSYIKNKKYANFQLASNDICEALSNYGLKERKTWNLNIKNIPLKFINSFLLGWFDGDGSISDSHINSNVNIGYSGAFDNLQIVSDYLKIFNINCKVYSDNHKEYNGKFGRISFPNMCEKYKFLKFIYKDCDIFLKRKKQRADIFIYNVENNITNRMENLKAIDDYNKCYSNWL